MASSMSRPRGNINPSVSNPDTQFASDIPNLSTTIQPSNNPPEHPVEHSNEQAENKERPRGPSLSTRTRAETVTSQSSTSSVKRKPLPPTASPLATKYSSPERRSGNLGPPEQPFSRPFSLDSPTLPPTSTFPISPAGNTGVEQSLNRNSTEHSALTADSPSYPPSPIRDLSQQPLPNLSVPEQTRSYVPPSQHSRLASDSALTNASESTSPYYSDTFSTHYSPSTTMSVFSAKPTPPHQLNVINAQRTYSHESDDSTTTLHKPLPNIPPKSPGASKLGSFFGWGGNTSPISPTTTFSDKSISPIPSPNTSEFHLPLPDASQSKNKPKYIDVPKANAESGSYFGNQHLQLPLATPSSPIQVEEMEKELKEISAELASSIRREMDLEDLVDRLQAEKDNPNPPGKRTSDYFSDSGTSSVRYGDSDTKQEDLDRMIRKTEQEKAQMRLELTNKVQEERMLRKQLESQIRKLEETASQVDFHSINNMDANGRLKDLEATCEDLRRRLAEERQVKDNFEDLLTALKDELQSSHNERDNLRDEIVPQLRARVEGLEAQAAEHEKLTYEQSKSQQELQALKNENIALINAQKMQTEMQHQMKKFESIAEESGASTGKLSRSNTIGRPPSLSRSTSVKATSNESREALAERVKDIELQRDALHKALKLLLERQEHQNRENQKKIRQLEMERDHALSMSPTRIGYDREVKNLREEINTLRRRADEAIEQKWQCEKGLSGLKMDLDRAEQEIGSLRSLLQEKDILQPGGVHHRSNSGTVSSESLERAYRDLQSTYSESLDRIKKLEGSGAQDAQTEKAMKELEKSLQDAISERDFAQQQADSLRQSSEHLRKSEQSHLTNEVALADELRDSAKRVEELAIQVRQQLASNATLRSRLAETISRGEAEQKTNAQKIMFMQSKLKSLEDSLLAAQQASEDKVASHEEQIRELKESHSVQLQRVKEGTRQNRSFDSKSQLSPMFANAAKAPMIVNTSSGQAMSVSEDTKVQVLRLRVSELETALAEADTQMEEVVGKMNIAQMEVMELQNEREEALRETKRVQKMIEDEGLRAFEGRFAKLSN